MVAAGHDEDDDKARKGSPIDRVLGMARAMLDVVHNITAPNGERLRIRIGVHCGPAFAGVIGLKCPRCVRGMQCRHASIRLRVLGPRFVFSGCLRVRGLRVQTWFKPYSCMVLYGAGHVVGTFRCRGEQAVDLARHTPSGCAWVGAWRLPGLHSLVDACCAVLCCSCGGGRTAYCRYCFLGDTVNTASRMVRALPRRPVRC